MLRYFVCTDCGNIASVELSSGAEVIIACKHDTIRMSMLEMQSLKECEKINSCIHKEKRLKELYNEIYKINEEIDKIKLELKS